MKTLDRIVALFLIGFFSLYLFMSYNFPLLPFEKFQSFKPNTLPKGIGAIGLFLSAIVLFQASGEKNKDNQGWRDYEWKTFAIIVILLSIYAATLKPFGFIISTSLFLTLGGITLGEKQLPKLIIISIISAFFIWFLVDKTLGIYLSPIPSFLR